MRFCEMIAGELKLEEMFSFDADWEAALERKRRSIKGTVLRE